MTEKQSMIFKQLNIITNKMEVIICNEYMQNIYLDFGEVWNYIAKGDMENHYNCNILKNVVW
jgi:hypothetical protein